MGVAIMRLFVQPSEWVLKLHRKNDKVEMGNVLGRLSLDGVHGTLALVDRVLDEVLSRDSIGMVGSEYLYRSAPKVMYANHSKVEKILNAVLIDWPDDRRVIPTKLPLLSKPAFM